MSDRHDDAPRPEGRRRRAGPEWFWKVVGLFGIGGPIVNREDLYGSDPQNDPYAPDFDPNRRSR
jgi:hypothetical protein